jgi:hypothetical protein
MVEELPAARGIIVSHETVRQWALKFGQRFAIRSVAAFPGLASNGRCQVANRQMLMAENSFSGGYAADAVPATSRHVRNAVSRAARCSLALR